MNEEKKYIEVEAKQLDNGDIDFSSIKPYVQPYERGPIHRIAPKMGRNEYCSIESKKFKDCCGKNGNNFCHKMLATFLEKVQTPNSGLANESN